MKWQGRKQSSNVEDRRNEGFSGGGNVGAFLPLVGQLIKTKVGRIVLIIGVIAYFLGFNPLSLMQTQNVVSKDDDNQAAFASVVLAQSEIVWHEIFKEYNLKYQEPKMVLFRNSTKSGCGFASSQVGPFYCPNDKKVYLDLSFFEELSNKFGASGDFANAYVIAHEVGHHVQNLLGILEKAHSMKQKAFSKKKENQIQVKVELQADCFAGIWANKSKYLLEEGDLQEALNAANAIGDDTLQRKSSGHVMPDSFTHGSSKDRMNAFKLGFYKGDIRKCNF